MRRPSSRSFLLLACAAAVLAACTAAAPAKKKKSPANPDEFGFDDDFSEFDEQPLNPDLVDTDSGAFGAGSRPASGDKDGGGGGRSDAGAPLLDGGSDGAVTKTFCAGPLKAGDLAIVELMISSRAGSGDDGEWAEIQSTRDCWLNLKGLRVESPRGQAAADVATITTDFELAPNDTFVVADSLDPAKNHNLPGRVIAFGGTDVFKNDGDTILIKSATGVAIDTLTYPAFNNLTPGRALSFPVDCAWADRSSWARWSLTFTEWQPGFKGTPNTDNDDVACF